MIGGEGGVPGCKSCSVAIRNGRRDPNWRNNVGLLIRWLHADGRWRHIQIDCGKTFRESVMTWYKDHEIHYLDAVLLTHDHADAIFGLDELRQLQRYDPVRRQVQGPPMQCYCDVRTMRHCRRAFPYLFGHFGQKEGLIALSRAWCNCTDDCDVECQDRQANFLPEKQSRFVAAIDWKEIPEDTSPFEVDNLKLHALPVLHGADYVSFGYGFGPPGSRVVYISDYSQILPRTEKLLEQWSKEGIAVMILDMLHPDSKKSNVHANLDESVSLIKRFRPQKAFLVGMGHYREHHDMNRQLRDLWFTDGLDIQLAHDGLFVPLQI